MLIKAIFFVGIMMILCSPAIKATAHEKSCAKCIDCHTLSNREAESLLGFDKGSVRKVKVSDIRGLWEITFVKNKKQSVAYMDFGKKHIINGPIYNLVHRKSRTDSENNIINQIPLSDSIVMGNPQAKKKLFAFVDPDCPYCAELHPELRKLVEKNRDICIYIKLFPLESIHPDSYDRSCVIMEKQSLQLLEDSYAGKPLPKAHGDSKAVDATITLGERLGIHGTPTLIFPDGRIVSGFMKAEEIESLMGN